MTQAMGVQDRCASGRPPPGQLARYDPSLRVVACLSANSLQKSFTDEKCPLEISLSLFEGCVLKQTPKKPVRRRPYPVVKMPSQSRILLDELMVEGWIIDVDMVEMADISRLICSHQVSSTLIIQFLSVMMKNVCSFLLLIISF